MDVIRIVGTLLATSIGIAALAFAGKALADTLRGTVGDVMIGAEDTIAGEGKGPKNNS